jgi:hypothetical protein
VAGYREFTEIRKALPRGVFRGEKGDCLGSALQNALDHSSYRYAEGVAKSAVTGFFYRHAWVVDSRGRVIDPVWDPVGTRYIGRVVPKWPKWFAAADRGCYMFEPEGPLVPDGEHGLDCHSAADLRRWEILMEAGGDAVKLSELLATEKAKEDA